MSADLGAAGLASAPAPDCRAAVDPAASRWRGVIPAINGPCHINALMIFMVIVASHWVEHAVQAIQIWVFDVPRAQARGALGEPFPSLVTSEWLHYSYALAMLIGLFLLRPGFQGAARRWWTAALALQFWHHIEHLLLLVQRLTGHNLDGEPVPTSLAQLFFLRFELHMFYNSVVTIPMVIAMWLYIRSASRRLPHGGTGRARVMA
ncbi:MAG: hypothetical protein ACT4PP_00915 [Sporichthyaceae bacterium]